MDMPVLNMGSMMQTANSGVLSSGTATVANGSVTGANGEQSQNGLIFAKLLGNSIQGFQTMESSAIPLLQGNLIAANLLLGNISGNAVPADITSTSENSCNPVIKSSEGQMPDIIQLLKGVIEKATECRDAQPVLKEGNITSEKLTKLLDTLHTLENQNGKTKLLANDDILAKLVKSADTIKNSENKPEDAPLGQLSAMLSTLLAAFTEQPNIKDVKQTVDNNYEKNSQIFPMNQTQPPLKELLNAEEHLDMLSEQQATALNKDAVVTSKLSEQQVTALNRDAVVTSKPAKPEVVTTEPAIPVKLAEAAQTAQKQEPTPIVKENTRSSEDRKIEAFRPVLMSKNLNPDKNILEKPDTKQVQALDSQNSTAKTERHSEIQVQGATLEIARGDGENPVGKELRKEMQKTSSIELVIDGEKVADQEPKIAPVKFDPAFKTSAETFSPEIIFSQPKLEGSLQQTIEKPQGQTLPVVLSREQIVEQVRDKLAEHRITSDNGQVNIKLHPADLGELKVTVRMEDQKLRIEIVTENRTVKEALMQNSDLLKDTLSKQNIEMERFNVSTASKQFMNNGFREGRHQEQPNQTPRQAAWMSGRISNTEEPMSEQWMKQDNALLDMVM